MRHLCVGYVRRALMTYAAKLILIDSQQPGEARLVGIMAGNASASQHGLVHRRHSQPFVHLIMALGAERLVIVHGEAGVVCLALYGRSDPGDSVSHRVGKSAGRR